MSGKVISFRVDDDVLLELEKRKLPGEASVMLCAQRILSEGLGLVKSTVYLNTDERITTALLPIQSELGELRSRLDAIEPKRTNSSSSTLVQTLSELLDTSNYPTNGTAKLRKRILQIIAELS